MPGSFHGISLASGALRAFQRGMDITGHNLANVGTRGYSRQTVEYGAQDPIDFYQGRRFELGQGVTITSINRIRDGLLDVRMQDSLGEFGRFGSLSTSLERVQPVFNEPGPGGIATALDRFFNSWSGLGSHPNDPAARLEVQQAGQTLANRIRTTFGDLRVQRAGLDGQVQAMVGQIDEIAARIASLNADIRETVATGGQANDLMDARDLAVEDLSKLVNIETHPLPNGELSVHFGGFPLVDGSGAHAFPSTLDGATMTASNGSVAFPIRGGELFGLMEASTKVAGYMSALDTLADTLRAEVNGMHRTGTNQNGGTDGYFFNQNVVDPQNGAIDFDLAAPIKADIRNIAAGVSGNPGDGGLAISLSNLRNVASPLLGGKTYGAFYSTLISQVGRDVEFAGQMQTTQEALVQQVESQRQSISGVSIDEEMAHMMRMQRSYQAAAKALSVFDQMTEELIGMLR